MFLKMLDHLHRVAPTDTTVLIEGESGTGKELVARAIHDSSKRSLKPFITVDCTGLPEALIESELFGHEKGAFTGAYALKRGLVEEADGGTLFLDEIGDIPIGLQAKLLRFLESGTYRRVGSNQLRHANVRLLSATHRPLKKLVENGEFRNDLYYRISTFPLSVPSLRERRDDLPVLITSLLRRIESGITYRVSDQALKLLNAYSFPGNIRELKNILERSVLLCDGKTIKPCHLSIDLASVSQNNERQVDALGRTFKPDEEIGVLLSLGLTKRQIAMKLGVSERTVYRILRSLQ
jgi:transcriptional regulator with PAS, ATPase and Fis domain